MDAQEILSELAEAEAVLTGRHFVYTSGERGGNHGPAYINMRAISHKSSFLDGAGMALANQLEDLEFDMLIGPETLGRSLAGFAASWVNVDAIWCDIVELEDKTKVAKFNPKLDFGRLVKGKRFVIIDDLLTTGGSIKLVADLITQHGGIVVAAVVVVRRSSDVGAEQCGVPILKVVAEVEGFEVLTRDQCEATGPCSQGTKVVRRPGHGWRLEELEPDFQPGFTDL
ncbi:MAG TPA: phosphoribosyltransferase family protein [Candidatus Saccharimonadales bacterium]|nr:phosphoribosyltransferase family protein [Candidatus Saccharimonadales bacterium]